MGAGSAGEWLYDLPRLLGYREALRLVGLAPEPLARLVHEPTAGIGGRLGLLPGSFNPPTAAHTGLAAAGLAVGSVDRVLFTLSTHTVDKEVITGAALEDRLLVLEQLAREDARLGVLLVNRGLYVEQAELIRATFPSVREVVFLVGFDKIVQIFDPRYYEDRDATLRQLFGQASFLVAPRGDAGPAELTALLGRPENRPFVGGVRPLELPPTLRDVASRRIREAVSAGAPAADQLPPAARLFVEETGAYDDRLADEPGLDRYRLRLALLDELEARDDRPPGDVDFRALFARAVAEGL